MRDRLKGERPMHVYHCVDVQAGSWSSPGERAVSDRGTAIKQPEQLCCCRLLFKGEPFNGIAQPAALIVPQNPRRNHYGPMKRAINKPA